MVYDAIAEGGEGVEGHYMAVHTFISHDTYDVLVVAFYADEAVTKSCLVKTDLLADGAMGLYLFGELKAKSSTDVFSAKNVPSVFIPSSKS